MGLAKAGGAGVGVESCSSHGGAGAAGAGMAFWSAAKKGGGGGASIHLHFHGPVVGGRQGLRELSDVVSREVMSGVRRGLVGQNA